MPHFSSLRCFIPCLLSLCLLAPQTAGAVDVEVRYSPSLYPTIEEFTSGTPPPEVVFPVACHIWRWGYSDSEKLSYVYAGCLVLHADYTVTYTPGVANSTFTKRRIDDFNGIATYKNPWPEVDDFSGMKVFKKYQLDNPSDIFYYQHTNNSQIFGAPRRSWNAFLLLLAHMIGYHHTVDHFVVTYGQDPPPGYVPELEIKLLGKAADDTERYSYALRNPLPGMRIVNFCDLNPNVDDWCGQIQIERGYR